jgi:hypothetical protein
LLHKWIREANAVMVSTTRDGDAKNKPELDAEMAKIADAYKALRNRDARAAASLCYSLLNGLKALQW